MYKGASFRGVIIGLFIFGIGLLLTGWAHAASLPQAAVQIPFPLGEYKDPANGSLLEILSSRALEVPINLISTLLFFGALMHTFLVGKFTRLAHDYKKKHDVYLKQNPQLPSNMVCYKAEVCHYLGEIEVVFGLWVVPLIFAILYFHGWHGVTTYLNGKVGYTEPIFVVLIMSIAATKPIFQFFQSLLERIASIGKNTPAAWWITILFITPLLGSFITEPAAITIAALMLKDKFYKLQPSLAFSYATLAILFVNISIGGTLTHFAAPPVLMVAGKWGWDTPFMLGHFGWKAAVGILLNTFLYWFIFRKEFVRMGLEQQNFSETLRKTVAESDVRRFLKIPKIVTLTHMLFLAWTVFTMHYPALMIGGFLFFLAFKQVTGHHQYQLKLREPLLVGFFLAGLVTHGLLQQWWLEPVLGRLSEFPLFLGATVLTAFNDNAAITFLASLVPEFSKNFTLQDAVVAGAVTGGGLTVIANAPNPAGLSILRGYLGGHGFYPGKLFLWALAPTLIVSLCFLFL